MTTKATRTLRPFVEALRIGDPIGHLNLTLVPLGGGGHGRLDYLLAQEALTAGQLTVTEVSEGGSVPELMAVNNGEKMILLLDGEELVGAKQNRILNTSVLLPARSKTKIPVSCVEQGRWHPTSPQFSSGHHSPSSLRARKSRDVSRNLQTSGVARSDQGAVWDEVQKHVVQHKAMSPTMAMHDVYEQRQNLFQAYVDALKYPADTRGVIVAIGGAFMAVDLFDKPATLERIWPRLITGYAMDAAARAKDDKSKPFTAKGAATLMEHVGEIDCAACPTVGVGEDWRFQAPDILGQSLVAEDTCLHLCAFPNELPAEDASRGPGILPPSRRRMNRGPRPGGD